MIAAVLAAFAQLSISVSAPDTVEERATFIINVVVNSPSLLPPTIVPPPFPAFTLLRTTANARLSPTPGSARQHALLETDYHLIAPVVGVHDIRPFEARLEGASASSAALTIVVRPQGSGALDRIPAVTRTATIDPDRSVSIGVLGTPDTVYVGEQATYAIAVFIDESVLRQRAARNPTFTPPDLRGTLSYELPPTRALIPSRRAGDRSYRPHVYQRAIFPLVPGRHIVPAATLDYTVPVSSAIYGREETLSLKADSVLIVALPLPDAGRPQGFAGAVGSLRLERALYSYQLRVGDPFTVRARVTGTGNIKLLPRPTLDLSWADVIPAGERVELDIVDSRVGGMKEFEWVVTPTEAGMQEFPAINYPFFEPASRQYQMASSLVESVEILPGALVVADEQTPEPRRILPIRSAYRGEKRESVVMNPLFYALIAAAPIPALLVLLLRRRSARAARAAASSRRGAARGAPEGGGEGAPDMIALARRSFLATVEERLKLPPGVAATESGFLSALLRAGVSRETAADAVTVGRALDAAVFGKSSDADISLVSRAEECLRRIDAEAVGARGMGGFSLFPAIALVLAVLSPQGGDDARAIFVSGVRLYASGEYADAGNQFLEVTRMRPRSVEAWVNLGAAAWESGDTAAAMISWQRAVRLAPGAQDVRANIARIIPTAQLSSHWIPPLSFELSALLALSLWLTAWGLAFLSLAKRWRFAGRGALIVGVLALCMGFISFELRRRVTDRRAAVVTDAVVARSLPALESQPRLRLNPGEVVVMTAMERDWARVELESRAVGWVHRSHLLRIAID